MAYPYYELVQQALADLKAEGKVRPRTTQAEIEQDKGLTVQRAAYYVHTQRDPNHGVFQKSGGNVYVPPPESGSTETFSVDWILRVYDGEGWDVVSDRWDGEEGQGGTGEAIVVEGGAHGPNPDNIPRWRMPTKALAQVAEGHPEPGPTPPPSTDRTDEVLQAIAASEARVTAHVTAETERVLQRLADYRQEVIEFAELAGKMLVVLGLFRRP